MLSRTKIHAKVKNGNNEANNDEHRIIVRIEDFFISQNADKVLPIIKEHT
jgi:hypothetical protein